MLRLFILGWFVSLVLFAQEGTKRFQLWLPDFSDRPFPSGQGLIEVPDQPIQRFSILVREVDERQFRPGGYKVFVNGKGAGNILDEKRSNEGTLLTMEPENLRKRPDEIFDPNENAIEFLAEGRNGRRYYQNWVIRRSGQERNSYFTYSSLLAPEYARDVAPDIHLTEPLLPPQLSKTESSRRLAIKGSFSSSSVLFINGEECAKSGAMSSGSFSKEIVVTRSQKEIVVEVKSSKGHLRRVQIPVYAVPNRSVRVSLSGNRYAVVIGLSRFGGVGQVPSPIAGAAAEAELFSQLLVSKAGFKPENVRTLLDEKATASQIRVAIGDFVGQAGQADALVLYVVTHAFHDPRPGKSENLYLASYETQLAALESSALSFSDLERMLSRSVQSNQAVLLFDVAHPLSDPWKFGGINLASNHLLGVLGKQPGRSVFVTASSNEVSQSEGSGVSRLSHWISKAVDGEADLNLDQVVSTRELFQYLTEKIRSESKGLQHPRFEGDSRLLGLDLAVLAK